MSDIPNFSSSIRVVSTDSGEAIATVTTPNFSTSKRFTPEPKDRKSVISQAARFLTKFSPVEAVSAAWYLHSKVPAKSDNESKEDYDFRIKQALADREDEILSGGIGHVMADPFKTMIAAGLVTHPLTTVVGVGGFTILDSIWNFREMAEEKLENPSPELLDVIEIIDFGLKGGIVGKGMIEGKALMRKTMGAIGVKRNINIKSEDIAKIENSPNLLPEDKIGIKETLGINDAQVAASKNSGLPINVPTEKILDLAEKPYWERTKAELGLVEGPAWGEPGAKPIIIEKNINQELIGKIKSIQSEKKLSNITVSKLKQFLEIENVKTAETSKMKKLYEFVNELKPEDKFMSKETIAGLKDVIKDLPLPEITPKRVIIEKFGEKEDIMTKGITGKIINELLPTVDIKQGHPLIQKIVEGAKEKLAEANKEVERRDKNFEEMISKAEQSRKQLISSKEKFKRFLIPQNKEIFQALSGEKVELTKEEVAVVAYLKNFFNMARKDLALEKYRKNYVTHIEKSFMEKILDKGIFPAIKEVLAGQKEKDLPVDILLELENIIGSEKFFRFAQERKGGIDPTTNLRQIVHTYSNMYETKLALDKILPEGQAITKNLLQGKSAVWMKKFLQNLKGRGMDNQFRTGKMGWLTKVADGIVDLGYLKLLALSWKSPFKNIVAGEANAWMYQDFPSYLRGKQRFWSDPKKAYQLAKEYGILEGTYSDYAQKGIGKLKKLQDFAMIGQRAGEVEVRSSIFTGMLSEKEWTSGIISKEKIKEINDTVAITQGIFSKVDSPLVLQTWWGRMFFQMNRWRITNAMLMKRVTNDALADIKLGKYNTQNTTRLGKMIVAYGIGMYISAELYKAGYKFAGDVARSMANTIDGVVTLISEGDLAKMFTENPTLQMLKEVSNTMMDYAAFLKVPGAKKSKGKGIEDTYIAPIETAEDIMELLQ